MRTLAMLLPITLLMSAIATAQTTTELLPTADAYIELATQTANHGTESMLLVRQANDGTNLTRASYLQFNLAGLPAGTITSARLRMYGRHEITGAGIPVDIRPSLGT